MFGYPPVVVLGVACALVGAGVIGWKLGPDNRQMSPAVAVAPASAAASANTISMPICGSAKRVNCIVDGDTIWVNREKIRLEGFNAPEMNGSCERERRMAIQARDELRRALDGRAFTIERSGTDRYGRTLATVRVDGEDVGYHLIRRGLAHEWRGRKEAWC